MCSALQRFSSFLFSICLFFEKLSHHSTSAPLYLTVTSYLLYSTIFSRLSSLISLSIHPSPSPLSIHPSPSPLYLLPSLPLPSGSMGDTRKSVDSASDDPSSGLSENELELMQVRTGERDRAEAKGKR